MILKLAQGHKYVDLLLYVSVSRRSVAQSCAPLSNHTGYSLPDSSLHGTCQSRILEWVAILFSSGPHSSRPLHHDPPILAGPTRHGLVSLRLWSQCD